MQYNVELEFLAEEIRRLHTQWDCFEQLFAPGRDKFRKVAGHTITVVFTALTTDIVLTISRLCDPVETTGKANLVFARFLDEHPHLELGIGAKIEELKRLYSREIKPLRNRRFAHNDLKLVRGEEIAASPQVRVLSRAKDLCTEIVESLYAELEHGAIRFVPSFVPGEIDWIETALRYADNDPVQLKALHQTVRKERTGTDK